MSMRLAVLPPRGSALGFASWAREMAALTRVTLSPPPFPTGSLPRGDGRAVLVIPGFLTGDWSTTRLREFLRGIGYRVERAKLQLNAGPTKGILARLEDRLMHLNVESGAPVALVGQSLGGVFARELAHKYPDKVRCVVTLCSPIRFPVISPLVPFVRALAWAYEPSWIARMEGIALPPRAPVTAIYSKGDGLVDWRQCLQDDGPGCENIPVDGSHAGMGSNPAAQAVMARVLAR